MYYTVYKTINKITGKYYIGQHKTIDPYDNYLGSGVVLSKAIDKHGRTNFEKEVLFIFDNFEDMDNKERELVDNKDPMCYNARPGGQSPKACYYDPDLQRKNALLMLEKGKETTKIRRETLFGYEMYQRYRAHVISSEYFKNNDPNFLGQEHKQETKDKIGKANSISQSGSRNSQYGTMWITDGLVNKKIKRNDPLPLGFRKGRLIGRGY